MLGFLQHQHTLQNLSLRVVLNLVKHLISSELSRKVRVSEESLIVRFRGQVSSRFKLKWVEEVKLDRINAFDDCSIA